jgi:hypothetical protein
MPLVLQLLSFPLLRQRQAVLDPSISSSSPPAMKSHSALFCWQRLWFPLRRVAGMAWLVCAQQRRHDSAQVCFDTAVKMSRLSVDRVCQVDGCILHGVQINSRFGQKKVARSCLTHSNSCRSRRSAEDPHLLSKYSTCICLC